MKKQIVITTVLICICVKGFSQSISGEAIYVFKQKIDIKLDSTKFEANVRDKVSAIFAEQFQQKFQLEFSDKKSLYRKIIKSNNPLDLQEDSYDKLYKNIKTKNYNHQLDFYGKLFLIKDSLTSYNWKLTSETKYIGKFLCYKAEAKLNNEEIIAWFTSEISINQGPELFWGLPGLILEVKKGDIHIACIQVVINDKKLIIKKPSSGREISQTEFDKIKTKKEKEKEQRFRQMQEFEMDQN